MGTLTDDLSYVWSPNDVYEIAATDAVEGAGIGASFGGIGIDNEPHQILANRAAFLNKMRVIDEANIAALLARNTWTNFQVFRSPTGIVQSLVIPTVSFFRAIVVGGGGAGAASLFGTGGSFVSGAGGGAGGYAEGVFSIAPGSTINYRIGAGGNAGNGGQSWLNINGGPNVLIANGGQAGAFGGGGTFSSGGLGGTASGPKAFQGGAGSDGQATLGLGLVVFAGNGAPGPWGGGGRAANATAPAFQNGAAPGAGGGGGYGGNFAGGKGADGIVIILW